MSSNVSGYSPDLEGVSQNMCVEIPETNIPHPGTLDKARKVGARILDKMQTVRYEMEDLPGKAKDLGERVKEFCLSEPELPPEEKVTTETRKYRNRFTKETKTTTSTKSKAGRVAGVFKTAGIGAGTGAVAVVNVPFYPILKFNPTRKMVKLLKKSAKQVASGRVEKTEITESTFSPKNQRDVKVNYKATNKRSLQDYIEDPKNANHIRYANGHEYLLSPEAGEMIFIPNGNRDQIHVIRFSGLYSGEPVTETEKLEKHARAYMVAYGAIDDKLDEMSKEAGRTLEYADFVIDYTHSMIRGYDLDANINEDITSMFTGVRIDISDSKWKEMNDFFDSDKTEKKQNLSGDKVYPNGIPETSHIKDKKRKKKLIESPSEEEQSLTLKRSPKMESATSLSSSTESSLDEELD